MNTTKKSILEYCFDIFCVSSILGIYPRFIEPKLLCTTSKTIYIPNLPDPFLSMKIVFISDFHSNSYLSHRYIKKIGRKIRHLQPDLILFGGDLLTYAQIDTKEKISQFLSFCSAPLGVYAVLGNHDYAQYATLDTNGIEVIEKNPPQPIIQGLRRLFSSTVCSQKIPCKRALSLNEEVLSLFNAHNVTVLHNQTIRIGQGRHQINLTGLGDITCKNLHIFESYKNYDRRYPGIIFGHNPDCYTSLSSFPGDLFLFGHTHGGQINLPFLWKKTTPLKDFSLKSGLYLRNGHSIFVSRGLGASFPFRLFAPPQITLLTLQKGGPKRIEEPSFLFSRTKSFSPIATSRSQNQYL